jgi:hypothetical protein
VSNLPGRQVLRHPLVRDTAVVLVWFVVIGLIGAVLWWQLTPLAEFTRTADNGSMGEEDLGRQVAADGWYFVIAAVGGLLSGIALLALRRRDPVAMVVLVAAGGVVAGWLMLRVGLWLGPPDPQTVLPGASVGDKVPLQLEPQAPGVQFVWPIAALVGAIGVIWGIDDHRGHRSVATPPSDSGSVNHGSSPNHSR